MDEAQAVRDVLWMLLTDARTGALMALLLVAAAMDCRTLRIPTWLAVGGMAGGLLYHATHAPSVGAGLWMALLGLATGLALLMPLYLLRLLQAGDLLLLGAMGAFLGAQAMPLLVVFVLATGGFAVLLLAVWRRAGRPLLANLRFLARSMFAPASGAWRPGAGALPRMGKAGYGLSICIGGLAFMVARQLGFV